MRRVSTTTEEMKSYIADALVALMERQDFSSITVQQIVTKAGVHRSTYYRHFESKEDVIRYYFHKVILEYIQECSRQVITFEQYTAGFYQHFLKYRKQILVIHQCGLSYLLHDVFSHLLISQVERHKTTIDQYNAQYQIGGTSQMFLFWFSRGMEDSAEDMAHYILQILPSGYSPYLMPKNMSQ